VEWLNTLPAQSELAVRAGFSVAGLIIFLIGLLLLVLEFVRFRRRTIRLRNGSGELTTGGVAEHLGYYIDLLPDVVRVQPRIRSQGKNVSATLLVETAPGINIPEKSSQIRETARFVLEEQLGLQVRDEIRVVIQPSSFPEGKADVRIPPTIASARQPEQVQPAEAAPPAEEAVEAEEAAEAEEVAPEELAEAETEGEQSAKDEIVEGEAFEFKAPEEGQEKEE